MPDSVKKYRSWKSFRIPKYIEEILKFSEFDLKCKESIPGYTIKLHKFSIYWSVNTLRNRAMKLVNWARSYCGDSSAELINYPKETHYCDQYAIINIFDPIMSKIEKLIRSEKEIKRDLY